MKKWLTWLLPIILSCGITWGAWVSAGIFSQRSSEIQIHRLQSDEQGIQQSLKELHQELGKNSEELHTEIATNHNTIVNLLMDLQKQIAGK